MHVYLGPHPRRTLLANKRADYFQALGYQPHMEGFCHLRSVFFQEHRGTIMIACAQAVALHGATTTARRHVAANMVYDEYDNDERHVDGVA
jgi:hypothetical protein